MGKDKRRFVRLSLSRPPERYFLILQLGIFLATLVFLLSILMTTVTSTMNAVEMAREVGAKLDPIFDQMIYSLFVKVSVLFAVGFMLNVLLGLFFLERLTGPLIRIQRVLEEIASGRIPESDVSLRKRDFPVELGNALSAAVAYLRRKKAGF